jgi:dolichyl-phosphate beta-glucosyltransferase
VNTASTPFVSIVIPAYNEERRILGTLAAIQTYLGSRPFSAEVLVVSDGSRDRTNDLVAEYAARRPGVRLIASHPNRGKGYVVRQGMLEASGTLRLFTDADNATPIEELDTLLARVPPQGECDVAIASIAMASSRVEAHESALRRLGGRAANALIQATVLPGIRDTQRGFKLFTAAAARACFARARIDRWGFDIEILALARHLGLSIAQVPVRWRHDPDSRVRASAYLRTLGDLGRIRFWLWTGAYDAAGKRLAGVTVSPQVER